MEVLTPQALQLIAQGQANDPATLKVSDVVCQQGKKFSCVFTDGSNRTMKGLLISAAAKQLLDGSLQLCQGDVVRVSDHTCSEAGGGEQRLIVTAIEVVSSCGGARVGAGGDDAAGTRADQQQQQPAPASPAPEGTPAAKRQQLTPGPTPSPSDEMRMAAALTPPSAAGGGVASRLGAAAAGPATPSASPLPVTTRANVQPIAALNPYDTNWCIKARVVRKAPPRSFAGRGGAPNRVFNVELADAMGGQVQGTFWREAAEKFADSVQEGKVYYFSKFTVRPANKQYATVRNDYELHFDARTEVEEAADQGGISAEHKVELVPLDRLPRHVGRKMAVDVLGVVVACGQLGTIKRKSDSSELTRRDVTLADASRSSVVLTLWGDQATRADLEGCEGQLMQVTCVRVGDYNGCSLSAVSRSEVTLNPEGAEAEHLRSWWEAEGRGATLTPLGQAGAGGAGGPRPSRLQFLEDVVVDGTQMPAPEAKPTYHDVVVSVMTVGQDDRPVSYLAGLDTNNKKVEPRDGRFWCASEGRYVDAAAHRYMFKARVADATGETLVNVFDDQGRQLLGRSADELEAMREGGDEGGYGRALRGAKWTDWSMTLGARCREYNGERRMHYSVLRMSPLDYSAEGHKLLQLIQGAGGAAAATAAK